MWCGVKQRIDEALGQTQALCMEQVELHNRKVAMVRMRASKHKNENQKVGF
jgi:hypothetical protein